MITMEIRAAVQMPVDDSFTEKGRRVKRLRDEVRHVLDNPVEYLRGHTCQVTVTAQIVEDHVATTCVQASINTIPKSLSFGG